ncbi:MAG: hypothetical protein R2713_22315 [Ilumatobacteraceae bacterium]
MTRPRRHGRRDEDPRQGPADGDGDPTQYDIQEPADIAETGAKVLHFPGAAYIDYMIANGIMTEDQDDPSYDGSDASGVAEAGASSSRVSPRTRCTSTRTRSPGAGRRSCLT